MVEPWQCILGKHQDIGGTENSTTLDTGEFRGSRKILDPVVLKTLHCSHPRKAPVCFGLYVCVFVALEGIQNPEGLLTKAVHQLTAVPAQDK